MKRPLGNAKAIRNLCGLGGTQRAIESWLILQAFNRPLGGSERAKDADNLCVFLATRKSVPVLNHKYAIHDV